MNPFIPMSRTSYRAIVDALDHVRRAASAAGCATGGAQEIARRLRAEAALLEQLVERATIVERPR